jgi:hypothetical protein
VDCSGRTSTILGAAPGITFTLSSASLRNQLQTQLDTFIGSHLFAIDPGILLKPRKANGFDLATSLRVLI